MLWSLRAGLGAVPGRPTLPALEPAALGDQEGVVRGSGKKRVGRAPPPGWGADITSLHKQQHPPTLSRGRDTSGRRAGCRAPGHMTTCLHFRGAPLQGSGRLGILLKPRGPLRGSFLPVGWRVDWSTPHARLLPRGTVVTGPCGPLHLAMLVAGAGTDLEAGTQPSGHWQDSRSAEVVGAQWTEMMPTEMPTGRSGT